MGIKLKGSFDTEVYISEGGFVCLKQDDPLGNDPAIVSLAAHQLPSIIEELQRLYADRNSWEFATVEPDTTG